MSTKKNKLKQPRLVSVGVMERNGCDSIKLERIIRMMNLDLVRYVVRQPIDTIALFFSRSETRLQILFTLRRVCITQGVIVVIVVISVGDKIVAPP